MGFAYGVSVLAAALPWLKEEYLFCWGFLGNSFALLPGKAGLLPLSWPHQALTPLITVRQIWSPPETEAGDGVEF